MWYWWVRDIHWKGSSLLGGAMSWGATYGGEGAASRIVGALELVSLLGVGCGCDILGEGGFRSQHGPLRGTVCVAGACPHALWICVCHTTRLLSRPLTGGVGTAVWGAWRMGNFVGYFRQFQKGCPLPFTGYMRTFSLILFWLIDALTARLLLKRSISLIMGFELKRELFENISMGRMKSLMEQPDNATQAQTEGGRVCRGIICIVQRR